MKAAVNEIKRKIKIITSNTGCTLGKNMPYYVNSGQIEFMIEAIQTISEQGQANPDRYYEITPKQKISLDNWINGLKRTYLFN